MPYKVCYSRAYDSGHDHRLSFKCLAFVLQRIDTHGVKYLQNQISTSVKNTFGAYQLLQAGHNLLHLQPWVQGVAHVGQAAIFTVQAVHAAEGG